MNNRDWIFFLIGFIGMIIFLNLFGCAYDRTMTCNDRAHYLYPYDGENRVTVFDECMRGN